MRNVVKAMTALIAIFTAVHSFAAPPGYRKGTATILEVQSLPQFCLWEYDERFAYTQKELRDCGVGTNHYCPAYLDFLRAQKTFDKRKKLQHLTVALKEVEYTLGWIHERKACPVRNHALITYSNIRLLYTTLGIQLPPPKFSGP